MKHGRWAGRLRKGSCLETPPPPDPSAVRSNTTRPPESVRKARNKPHSNQSRTVTNRTTSVPFISSGGPITRVIVSVNDAVSRIWSGSFLRNHSFTISWHKEEEAPGAISAASATSTQFRAVCGVPQGSGPSCQCGETQPKLTQMDKQPPDLQKLQKRLKQVPSSCLQKCS